LTYLGDESRDSDHFPTSDHGMCRPEIVRATTSETFREIDADALFRDVAVEHDTILIAATAKRSVAARLFRRCRCA
jgi:hypothetical protein